MPPYRPELNPDEGLDADLKQAVSRKPPVHSKLELKRTVISHMGRLTKLSEQIGATSGISPFHYAA